MPSGQTHEGSDQSDDDETAEGMANMSEDQQLAQDLDDDEQLNQVLENLNMDVDNALVVTGGLGVAAGGGGGVGNNLMLMPPQDLVMYDFNGCYKFRSFYNNQAAELKHDMRDFKMWVISDKLLAVGGRPIFNCRINASIMVTLLDRLYDQYSWQFMQYVFRDKIEPPQIYKKRAQDFHKYLFEYKTNKVQVLGGTCDYQMFRNKIVIPVLIGAYGQQFPMTKFPDIPSVKLPMLKKDPIDLQFHYFTYPDPIEFEQTQEYQLQLDVPVTAF